MAKGTGEDKDKDKDQEGDVLDTENAPDDEDQSDEDADILDAEHSEDSEDGKEIDTELLLEQIAEQDQKILKLEGDVKSLKAKKAAGDASNLAGAIKALAGLALSPDGFASFQQMVPYLFEE